MRQTLSAVTLAVADLAASRAFYVDGLGWKPDFENEHVMFFQMNGFVFALYHKDGFEADVRRKADARQGAITLAHNVASREAVDAAMAEALAAGAGLLRPAEDQFWGGYSGHFADPDGHAWEVAWNPSWPILEDGSVRLGM